MVEISTSVLSVKKEEAVKIFYGLEIAKTNYFHIDVMDGEFVKNKTTQIMHEYANTIKQISNIPIDVHLMVKNVKEYVDEYSAIEPYIITFHYEALENDDEVMQMIEYIKKSGSKVGITLKPNTSIEKIYKFLPYVHMVLVMTVEPGEGGQKLIPQTLEKIKKVKEYITKNNIDIAIEADGGINNDTIEDVINSGADIAVVGNAIINSENYEKTIQKLKKE